MDSSQQQQQLELSCSKGIFFFLTSFVFRLFLVMYVSPSFNSLFARIAWPARGKEEGRVSYERDKTIYRCRDRVN